MNSLIIWAYVEKEISELKPMFEDIFEARLTRDYETYGSGFGTVVIQKIKSI